MNRRDMIMKGVVKRMGITVLCCLPCLVVLGYLTQSIHRVAQIAIFTLFMAVVICFEEYIHLKISTKKQIKNQILHKDEDVFK